MASPSTGPYSNITNMIRSFDNASGIMGHFENSSATLLSFTNISNGSLESAPEVSPGLTTLILSVCRILVSILIFLGNILVLITIMKRKEFQTPSNIYLFNLAITDIMTGVSCVISVAHTYVPPLFDTAVLCPVVRLGTVVHSMMLSVFFMTCIAVDRLIAVYNPLTYKTTVTTTRTTYVIGLVWLYSFIISYGPAILGFHNWALGDACYLAKTLHRNAIFNLIANFYVASVVIIIAYGALFKIASRHMREIAAMEIQGPSVSLLKMHVKASKTLSIVIGTFAVCWWPYAFNLINLVLSDPGNPNSTAKKISNILLVPLFLNSGMNPIIYARKLPGFKREYIRILTCYRNNGENQVNDVNVVQMN